MSTANTRRAAALHADPLRAWIAQGVGIIVGAEEALADYDARFCAWWDAQEVLTAAADLGVQAGLVVDGLVSTLATSKLAPRR